ncbi:ABC transporter permease [Gorillibacterium timonense]|uniref:ABC transporter permease n=1 Tax=Gorillibacterium timonense TaxID=1689269 RepID=UPI00071CBF24|nr:ABC transporter permease [Gorillibacterium timonense]
MNFFSLVGKEMKMLSRNLVFYLLIAVILLFFYGNYATSESWEGGKAPKLPQKQEEQVGQGASGAANGSGEIADPGATGEGSGSGVVASPGAAGEESSAGAAPSPVEGGADNPADVGDPAEQAPPPMPVYGFKNITEPELLAQRYQWSLEADLKSGSMEQRIFFGMFAHKSKLSASDRDAMNALIAQLNEVQQKPGSYTSLDVVQMAADLDRKLGGWTHYMRDGMTFMDGIYTYEEAMAQYRLEEAEYLQRVKEGQVYPGMARLFCDYMGLTAGIFPVFLAAFALSRDRASRMNELIASRRVRAWSYVGARFTAYALLISLVYLLLSVLAAWETAAALEGEGAFWTALPIFLAHGAGWLLPTVWATTAFGMLVYTLFGSGLAAIPLQIAWWLISALPLIGDYRLYKLILRFNTPTEAATYRHYAGDILTNRIFYSILALLMVEAAALLWERRRSSGHAAKRRIRKRHANSLPIQEGGR